MNAKQKLELTWIGKDQRPRLEPRILIEDREKSHASGLGLPSGNILIHGDNLLGLRAIEPTYSGLVKCIYIDPPYNTGNAFEHYDDGIEHSIWLSLMRDRLVILHHLLSNEGFLCCHIDDSESHYLKAVIDEIFGRDNYLTTLYVQVRYAEKTLKQDMAFHKQIEQVLVYRKSWSAKPNQPVKDAGYEKFCYEIEVKNPHKCINLGGRNVDVYKQGDYKIKEVPGHVDGLKEIWATGSILDGNSSGRFFRDHLQGRITDDGLGVLYRVPGIGDDGHGHRYFTGPQRASATKGKYFQGVPLEKRDNKTSSSAPIENFYDMAGAFGNCRHEGDVDFRSGKKPESLVEMIIKYFSKPGDIVLDSFAGSGTTGCVAHKMGRRWVMIEMGEHCLTHILPRLKGVISGVDQSGASSSQSWKGGGGFRYFTLGPSLITQDEWGRDIIAPAYRQNSAMLIEAMCKLHGYAFNPSEIHFWLHGQSTERDFIYVTTQSMTKDQVAAISDEVGPERTLLICCGSHRLNDPQQFPNITVEKIPKSVLEQCEWGKDDYSLKIRNLPVAEDMPEVIPEAERAEAAAEAPKRKRGRPRKDSQTDPRQASFFDAVDATETKS